jgi:hypothetical protein
VIDDGKDPLINPCHLTLLQENHHGFTR